jgi:hypothetical protein
MTVITIAILSLAPSTFANPGDANEQKAVRQHLHLW